MAKQNIFDNETFFEGYKAIRDRKGNANDLFEIPALFSLLPEQEDLFHKPDFLLVKAKK